MHLFSVRLLWKWKTSCTVFNRIPLPTEDAATLLEHFIKSAVRWKSFGTEDWHNLKMLGLGLECSAGPVLVRWVVIVSPFNGGYLRKFHPKAVVSYQSRKMAGKLLGAKDITRRNSDNGPKGQPSSFLRHPIIALMGAFITNLILDSRLRRTHHYCPIVSKAHHYGNIISIKLTPLVVLELLRFSVNAFDDGLRLACKSGKHTITFPVYHVTKGACNCEFFESIG